MQSVTAYEGWMATVTFTDASGHAEAITGTSGHPIYSLDRRVARLPLCSLTC